MANWARAFDELGTGLLRQADIGGRAYEGAMAKEAEQRAANRALRAEERGNTEWARRHGITSQEARDLAELQHGYTMPEQQARLTSAEDIAGAQITSGEKMGFAGIASREDIAKMGITSSEIIAGMNLSSAESQNDARIAAQKFLQNERLDFQEGESVLDRDAQKANTDALIAGRADAAQKVVDARWNELALARQWAMDDAKSAAKSTEQKQAYDAKVKQAEAEEAGLAALYGELGTEDLDEVRRDEILNLIYAAQDRVAAAWRATGIAPLMSDKHIKESQWKFLAKNIVGAIALEYRNQPEAWDDLIISLHGKKDSSAYKKSVEGITPTIELAIGDSLLRGGPKDKTDLKNLVISYIANYRATELSGGYGEDGAPWKKDPTLNEAVTAEAKADAAKVYSQDQAYQAGVAVGEVVNSVLESFKNMPDMATTIQAAAIGKRINKWADELTAEEVIIKVREQVTNAPEREKQVWKTFLDELDPKKGAMLDSPGMLNSGGGLINAIDRGISPEELAQWEPEAGEARLA